MDEGSTSRRDLYLTTHNTHTRHIHVPGVIRNRNLSKREAAGPRGFSQTIVMHNLIDKNAFTLYFPIHFNHFTCISRGITLLHKIISFIILRQNPTNALYMLTPLYSHYYTPTCFSPRGGGILRDYWYISWAGWTIYVSRCKYQIKEQRAVCYVAVVKVWE